MPKTKPKERIVRYTQEELERMPSRTDWARVDAMTDEDIARQIAEDPDVAPEWTEEEDQMLKRKPGQRGAQKTPTKESITLRLDRDVLAYFRAQGAGWQSRINEALRAAMGK